MRLPVPVLLLLAGCPSEPGPGGDGVVDTGCPASEVGTWYRDGDGDGFGDPDAPVEACAQPAGTVADATDCDDDAAAVYPGAEEIWYDGADEDCSGGSDFDQDGDGYERDEECDDLDPERYPDPSVEETWYDGVDDDCDGNDGDRDGDGFYVADYRFDVPAAYRPGDCADDPAVRFEALNGEPDLGAADVHPDAPDVPYDGIDADCDQGDDFDADRDGFRTDRLPDGSGAYGDDCDDRDAAVHPGAEDRWYDGVDADCRGNDDFDQDYDGYAVDDGDCDDADAGSRPGAVETCGDDVDQDCDGSLNGANMSGCTDWYEDRDGDGFGLASACACEPFGVYTVASGGDCDDADTFAFPGAPELCDGRRNDCDDRGWSTGDEYGAASWEDLSGGWTDVTASVTGGPYTPATYTLGDAGTLWLCQGTFYAQLEVSGGDEARVVGRYGAMSTVVSASTVGTTITATDPGTSLTVEGVAISGGSGTYGGGVGALDATVELVDCIVSANQATWGAGVYAERGALTLRGVDFLANAAASGGGGVLTMDAEVVVEDTDFAENLASGAGSVVGGGMVYVATGAQGLAMSSVLFEGNAAVSAGADAQGGGLYLGSEGSGVFTLDSVYLSANAARGATFAYGGGTRASIGGAVEVSVTDHRVNENTVAASGAAYGGGLCLEHWGSGDFRVDSSSFEANEALGGTPAGGGVFSVPTGSGDISFTSGSVVSNGTYDASGVSEAGEGGGLYLYAASTTIGLEDMYLYDNAALNGDGIEYVGDLGADLQVLDSEIVENGGYGILYYGYDTSNRLILDGTLVTGHLYYGVYMIARSGRQATFTCAGDPSTAAGLYANDYFGLGGACASGGGTCVFRAESCDLGEERTTFDNGTSDLYIDTYTIDGFESDAWFTCTNASCS